MKYTITINQKQAIELGITNINQLFIFDLLCSAELWAKSIIIDGSVHYWVARQKVTEELPILNLKPDTVYRHLKELELNGFITYVKHGNMDCITVTEKGKNYSFGNKSTTSEAVPNGSEVDSSKSEAVPTYKTTTLSVLQDNKKEPADKAVLPDNVNNTAWLEFVAHRKSLRKPFSKLAQTKILNIMKRHTLENQQRLVDYSIAGGYPNLYENQVKDAKQTSSVYDQNIKNAAIAKQMILARSAGNA